MSYGNGLITITANYDLSTGAKNFTGYQIPGEHLMIQVDGSMISGTINFDKSIDGVTWFPITTADSSIRMDASVAQGSYLLEVSNPTPMKWMRPVLRVAGGGKLRTIRILYS
jgi:hypothetical protein